MPTFRRRTFLSLLSAPLVAAAARLEVDGQVFDTTLRLADSDLVLNGVGFRAVLWIKGYAAALYLGTKAREPAQVIAAPGPKRLQMRMMQDVSAQEFVKAVNVGIERNTPAAEYPLLVERQAEFARQVQLVGEVKKGDVVNLDFIPGRGLVFTLNGQSRGEAIAGADFYAAVLRIFIGDKPVDKALKAGLLGGGAP